MIRHAALLLPSSVGALTVAMVEPTLGAELMTLSCGAKGLRPVLSLAAR